MEITPIYIDYRGEQTTASYLGTRGINIEPNTPLTFGDLSWHTENHSYGVELKSVSDCLNSLYSIGKGERLENQLAGLREVYDRPVLGIHGVLWAMDGNGMLIFQEPRYFSKSKTLIASKSAVTKITQDQLEGFLLSICYPDEGRSVHVIWRPSKAMLLDAIIEFYNWSEKDKHETFNHVTARARSRNPSLDVLMCVPKLGEKRARALLDKFGTVMKVLQADDMELLHVAGIGSEIIRNVRKTYGN